MYICECNIGNNRRAERKDRDKESGSPNYDEQTAKRDRADAERERE
jgi:hypothetical protein